LALRIFGGFAPNNNDRPINATALCLIQDYAKVRKKAEMP